jgi:hypothetical protein
LTFRRKSATITVAKSQEIEQRTQRGTKSLKNLVVDENLGREIKPGGRLTEEAERRKQSEEAK